MIMSKTMFPVRSAPIIPISLAVESMLGCVCARSVVRRAAK